MNNGEKQSWWSTVPGTITAIATLITAVGGLIVILKSIGVFDSHTNEANVAVKDTSSAEKIYLNSKLIIRYPYSYDLDAGMPYNNENSNAEADFIWNHPTSMEFELKPDLGKFNLVGKENFEKITLSQLQKMEYSKNSINADLLLEGVVVAVITKEKRFGKFVVTEAGLEPSINVIIYDNK